MMPGPAPDLADALEVDDARWMIFDVAPYVYRHELWVTYNGKDFRLCAYTALTVPSAVIAEDIPVMRSLLDWHWNRAKTNDQQMDLAEWQLAFLCHYEETGNVIDAARKAGIAHTRAYYHKRKGGLFAEAWDEVRTRLGKCSD